MKIGFIGQGWIGRNYANNFEERGYSVVRYGLEKEYIGNRDLIKDCDITVIAVPTPTTPEGFNAENVKEALSLIGEDKIAVIKSTILPGTTARLQEQFPNILVFYSPEFLSEATAAYDAANPFSNIVGLSKDTPDHRKAAEKIQKVLPVAPFSRICTSTEAEIIKYSHNASGYTQIVLFNVMYDLAQKLGANWEYIQDALEADPFICNRYAKPVHKSGRGAGGGCFIKDLAALRELYEKLLPEDSTASLLFRALESKNNHLLTVSGKDQELLHGVYGDKKYNNSSLSAVQMNKNRQV
jgi:nucleotide sugar dehydrogenase